MQARELRSKYLEFFESKGALRLPSESLVADDPTLLFTVAGMVPMKPYYWGTATPPRKSITTTQKCLRTIDIDDIGDTSHCTFFEMLGNFSFGDYFKSEAIAWAWEFLTVVLKLDPKDLRVTIFKDDDEAYSLWRGQGLPPERISRLGEKTNYWPSNAIKDRSQGPCGPCSEIFFDRKPELPFDTDWDGEGDRWLEIWNLVFTQFNGAGEGDDFRLDTLPIGPSIDTGMGLDRTAAAINRLAGPFETDLLRPVIARLEELSGKTYTSTSDSPVDIAFRRIADHTRATAFLLADGVTPDRSGHGYVLRRLMRRAIVAGIRVLGFADDAFLHHAIPMAIENMSDAYPELAERSVYILEQVRQEEALFRRTLQNGLSRLDDELAGGALTGRRAYYLYETFGLPFEITREIASERGIEIDREGYEAAEEEARNLSRKAQGDVDVWAKGDEAAASLLKSLAPTKFVGYDEMQVSSPVAGLLLEGAPVSTAAEGQIVDIMLAVSPFYAESGGQVSDSGVIDGLRGSATVTSVRKQNGIWLHRAEISRGTISAGETVAAFVDVARRRDIMRNHTATHLLHKALRDRLGSHVAQRGSLVAPDRLRFDFAHGQALTEADIRAVETEVNEAILAEMPVVIRELPIDEARGLGAMMLFGEKYGDVVRVVSVGGEYSREFCGGTHVGNAAQIGPFRLVAEASAAAGIRRIEALTGRGADAYDFQNMERLKAIGSLLSVSPALTPEAVDRLLGRVKALEGELKAAKQAQAGDIAAQLAETAKSVNGKIQLVLARVDADDLKSLSDSIADKIAEKVTGGVVILAAEKDGKAVFVVKATRDAVGKGIHAGDIVKAAAQAAGGGGGGRPDFAQAGGRDASKIEDALAAAEMVVERQVG